MPVRSSDIVVSIVQLGLFFGVAAAMAVGVVGLR